MANSVSVSAVPFNPQTQTFGSTPAQTNQYSMGSVNLSTGVSTPAQQTQVQPVQPTNVPQSQNISTFTTPKITLPQTTQTNTPPISNYAGFGVQQIQTPVQDTANSISNTMLQLLPQLQGQTQELKNQENTLGVTQMRQNLQDLSNQILQKNAELNQGDVALAQGLQNIQDQAIPMQFITGQQQSVQNQANLAKAVKISNINMLNATAQATQGNIALAQQTAQDAVDLKYAPIKDMFNTLQAQLQVIQPLLTQEEKRVATQQSAMYDLQKTLLTNKQSQESKFMDLVMKAPTDYGSTPDQVARAIQTYQQTGDVMQAAQALTGMGGSAISSYFDTQDASRNALYNGVGQLTIDNGYDLNAFKKGIAGVESSNNYNAIGPATSTGDKAYGKYQVMGANIPSWTKAATGTSMTVQQFLNSPDAQEKVFENQSLTNYAKYGNWDDVASVWFSGKPLLKNNASDGYNTVPSYVSKVRTAMGVPAQPTTLSVITNPSAELWGREYQKNGDISKIPKQFQTMALGWAQQNVENSPQMQNLVSVYDLVNELDSAPGKEAAVGMGFKKNIVSILPFAGPEAIPGTSRADFEAKFNQLKDSLSLSNIDKLKGSMSDKDLVFLRNTASALSLDMSEDAFNKELKKIKDLTQGKILYGGGNILGGTVTDSYFNAISQPNSMSTTTSYGYQF